MYGVNGNGSRPVSKRFRPCRRLGSVAEYFNSWSVLLTNLGSTLALPWLPCHSVPNNNNYLRQCKNGQISVKSNILIISDKRAGSLRVLKPESMMTNKAKREAGNGHGKHRKQCRSST